MFRTPITLIAAAALVVVPVTSMAQPNESEFATAEVQVADLNLDSQAGQNTFNTRVNAAIRKVCGVSMDAQPLRDQMQQRQCVNRARGEATVLAAKHSSRTLAVR